MSVDRPALDTGSPQHRAQALQALQDRLRAAGAPLRDAVGWHYIERLSERSRNAAPGMVMHLLQDKLEKALRAHEALMKTAGTASPPPAEPQPSPLTHLLREMGPANPQALAAPSGTLAGWRASSPRVEQFRKQLRKIGVRKQVRRAIAQAPQNAGPINSHMLVLRALGLMRDISPDYLDRFMMHVDSLLRLEDLHRVQTSPRKTAPAKSARK